MNTLTVGYVKSIVWHTNKIRFGRNIPAQIGTAIRGCCRGYTEWPLLLTGTTGCGKSCAALVLCDHVEGSLYYEAADFCQTMGQAMRRELYSESMESVLIGWNSMRQRIGNAPLVVIDELGKGLVVDKVSEHQKRCIQMVLEERERKPLVFVSNLSAKMLYRLYGPSIESRLCAGTERYCNLPDLRKQRTHNAL